MVFHHLDVWNGDYNRSGRIAESDARFPAEDASIDLAFAMSVFTHMRLAGIRCYLKEAARVLRPGGRLAFTVLALEPGRDGPAIFDLQPFEEASAVIDRRSPERAIAHQRAALELALVEVGLRPTIFQRGLWRPPADYDGGHDLIVAIRPESSSETILPG
jgi:SAM-dependent methyltransferase